MMSKPRNLFFFSLTIVLGVLSSTARADHYRGILTTMTQDHQDGSATESLILEQAGQPSFIILNSSASTLSRYIGQEVEVDATVQSPGILVVHELLRSLPRTRRATARSESGLRLLVGVFDIGSNLSGENSAQSIRNLLIDDATRSVKKLLEANSFGAVTISTVTVAARSTLAIPLPDGNGNCFPWYSGSLLPAVRSVFTDQGISSDSYDRVLLVLPEVIGATCNFAGVAISSRETLYSGGLNSTLVLHELGHNNWPVSGQGFGHASSDANNDGTIDSVYGDNFDAMGISGYWYNFGHAEKEVWWTRAGGTTATFSTPGTYVVTLPSAEFHPRDAGGAQRVQITIDGDPRPYYVTFRKMVGTVASAYYDAFVDDRLNIHRPPVSPSRNTLILGEVIEGNSFALSSPALLVEFLGQADNKAQVRITIGTADSDGDGIPNSLDSDDDNDGFADAIDCSPTISTRWTTRAYLDFDKDGIATSDVLYDAHVCVGSAPNTGYTLTPPAPRDNCPSTANPSQADSDNDGIGDACDTSTPGSTTPGSNPGSPTTPGAPPPSSSSPPPIVALVSSRVAANILTIKLSSIGNSDAPVVSCTAKVPGNPAFGSKNLATSKQVSALRKDATCRVPLKKVGTYTIRVSGCEGTLCTTNDYKVRRKK